MEELLYLLEQYISIDQKIWFINSFSSSLDEKDVDEVRKKLFSYFNNFKHYNFMDVVHMLLEKGTDQKKAYEISMYFDVLIELNEKYQINSITDLTKLILEKWNENKVYDDRIIANVILIDGFNSKYHKFPKSEVSILPIYKDIVNNNLINPNLIVGSSSEMLYTMLPEDSSCYEYNLKVLSNPNIRWNVLRNASNPFGDLCHSYTLSKTDEEKKYYHDAIITVIKGSCSLFNNKSYTNYSDECIRTQLNYNLMAGISTPGDMFLHLKDNDFINELKELLLTDEVFYHQLELYTEKNKEADKIIEELKDLRNQKKLIKK